MFEALSIYVVIRSNWISQIFCQLKLDKMCLSIYVTIAFAFAIAICHCHCYYNVAIAIDFSIKRITIKCISLYCMSPNGN